MEGHKSYWVSVGATYCDMRRRIAAPSLLDGCTCGGHAAARPCPVGLDAGPGEGAIAHHHVRDLEMASGVGMGPS